MSVNRNRIGGWDVRWREGGKFRSKTFRLKRDADRFDLQVKDAKQTGMLPRIHGGAETLDEYVENTWAPIHAAAARAQDAHRLHRPVRRAHQPHARAPTRCAISRRRSSAAGRPTGSPPAPRASGPARRSRSWAGSFSARSRRSDPGQPATACPQSTRRTRDEVRPLAPITVERIRQALLVGRAAMARRRRRRAGAARS